MITIDLFYRLRASGLLPRIDQGVGFFETEELYLLAIELKHLSDSMQAIDEKVKNLYEEKQNE